MAEELKFYKWIHNAQQTFFCPEFYNVDFSRRAGDFSFKLVASAKILVAMATKVVATWRVDLKWQHCRTMWATLTQTWRRIAWLLK